MESTIINGTDELVAILRPDVAALPIPVDDRLEGEHLDALSDELLGALDKYLPYLDAQEAVFGLQVMHDTYVFVQHLPSGLGRGMVFPFSFQDLVAACRELAPRYEVILSGNADGRVYDGLDATLAADAFSAGVVDVIEGDARGVVLFRNGEVLRQQWTDGYATEPRTKQHILDLLVEVGAITTPEVDLHIADTFRESFLHDTGHDPEEDFVMLFDDTERFPAGRPRPLTAAARHLFVQWCSEHGMEYPAVGLTVLYECQVRRTTTSSVFVVAGYRPDALGKAERFVEHQADRLCFLHHSYEVRL